MLPPGCVRIEVYVGELRQLFNAMDPSPFREKDLDPKAEEFIVGWARELHRAMRRSALLVHLDRPGRSPTARRSCATPSTSSSRTARRRRGSACGSSSASDARAC